MASKPGKNLDKWRNYFLTANSDIFDIIEHAIMVAASDCPKEFKLRRDRIAETLFSSKLSKCSCCDRVELSVPGGGAEDREDAEDFKNGGGCGFGAGGSKESKVNSNGEDVVGEMNVNQTVSNYSYGDAEALTEVIEEENRMLVEVLRIKEIFDNSEEESDSLLFDSLRRLQLMVLSVEILKATEIGKAVNALRKHSSKDIRELARTLIMGWKVLVDEWVNAANSITGVTEGTPDSINPSVVDEEEGGLPSPPLDDLAFFASQPMELSEFFDGMDDDGNPRNSGEFKKNRESGRKPAVESCDIPKPKQRPPNEPIAPLKDKKGERTKKQEALIKKQMTLLKPKPSINESGPGRPTKLSWEQKVRNETKFQQKPENITMQRPLVSQNKSRCSDDAAVQDKLEATKRKLQERYQQAENAKRQRTIQVMELHDLPKQGLGHKNPHVRPGNHNRHWANGRR